MKYKFLFEKKKFLSLTDTQRHKKCAELLQEALQKYLKAPHEHTRLLKHYKELLLWMQKELAQDTPKALMDCLFEHQKEARIWQKEYDVLTVERFDKIEGAPFLPISIYLENLRSLHNIGSIIRTCEAFRLGSVFFSGSHPLNMSMLKKSAMGAESLVEVRQIPSFEMAVQSLPRPLIVLETCPQSTPYYDFVYPDSFTLTLGNEAYGTTDALLKAADNIICIPLFGRKNSLNVANAFSIVCADIVRKKRP